MVNTKPEKGEVWRNIHTEREFVIWFKCFFTIAYYPTDAANVGEPLYKHYKTFGKNFVRVTS